jgi:hypothetical protein
MEGTGEFAKFMLNELMTDKSGLPPKIGHKIVKVVGINTFHLDALILLSPFCFPSHRPFSLLFGSTKIAGIYCFSEGGQFYMMEGMGTEECADYMHISMTISAWPRKPKGKAIINAWGWGMAKSGGR